MRPHLQAFFDNTKHVHLLLALALLFIVVLMVAPIGWFLNIIGQVLIIALLSYILHKNYTETHKVVLLLEQEEEVDDDIKNNTLASYVLCGFIFLLLLYVIYSLFF
jgi:predicted ABC-type exoprotein transport system permease subunit